MNLMKCLLSDARKYGSIQYGIDSFVDTKIEETVVLNQMIFLHMRNTITGFTVESVIFDVDETINDYQ